MMRFPWIAAILVGSVVASSAPSIEVINNSSRTVVVSIHIHHADNVGANFELYDYYWQTEGWWSVKPGKSVKLFSPNNATCWMRMTYDTTKGQVIRPKNPAAGPTSLIVHDKAFKIRRMGPDRDDTWRLTIGGKVDLRTVKADDAVRNYGCWRADGFYGYKWDTRFTIDGAPGLPTPPLAVAGMNPDPNLTPGFGSTTLKVGFEPDPFVKPLGAGGTVKTNLGGLQAYVGRAPDFRLNYTAGSYPLTIRAESNADTTLLIRLPNGKWIADDDSGNNLNPLLRFATPLSGRYDIWVGTLATETAPARLIITER